MREGGQLVKAISYLLAEATSYLLVKALYVRVVVCCLYVKAANCLSR